MTKDRSSVPIMGSDSSQPTFMGVLPSEIVPLIFAHLSQRDCMNCMAVCRAWYYGVPQHTQRVWETVSFNPRYLSVINKRLGLCLGKHVRTVVLDCFRQEDQLYNMIQRLLERGCLRIKLLRFRASVTEDQLAFARLLRQLSSSLTHLEMTTHLSNVSFFHIFNACPKLTHFTFDPSANSFGFENAYTNEPFVPEPAELADQYPNIIYLHLNAAMDEEHRVAPVVKRCPNLRSFIGSTNHVGANISTSTVLRLDRLISWCPNITYLQTTSITGYLTTAPKHDIQEHAYNDRGVIGEERRGLRRFGSSRYYSCDEISRVLRENQATLEYVSIGKDEAGANWSSAFQSLNFPQLRGLVSYGLRFDAAALVALLNGCPSIRTLNVRGADLKFQRQTLESLRTLENLRVLELIGAVVEDSQSMATMIHRLPALESLSLLSATLPLMVLANIQHLHQVHISINTWKDIESYDEASRRLLSLSTSAMESKTMETLILRAPKITYDMLLRIVNSHQLRHVDVAVSDAMCGEDQAGLYRFIKSLQKCTALNTLRLCNVRFLSYNVFEILSGFRCLKKITAGPVYYAYSVSPATQISNAGLIHLLRNGTKVEYLRFNAAELVDKDNRRLTLENLVRQMQKEVPSYTAQLMHGLDIGFTKVTDLLIERSQK